MDALNDFLEFAGDVAKRGWHERNGGNLSLHVANNYVAYICEEYRALEGAHPKRDGMLQGWLPLQQSYPHLANQHFIVTATGCFMRRVPREPLALTGLICLDDMGDSYRIVAGFENGGQPTSELDAHLCIHAACPQTPVVYHAHPTSLIALSHHIEPSSEAITATLWSTFTECPIFTPQGIGAVSFKVPGSLELANETARLCTRFPAVLWDMHGMLVHTASLDEAYGLMETLEKAADIALCTQGMPGLTADDLRAIDAMWQCGFNREMLAALDRTGQRFDE